MIKNVGDMVYRYTIKNGKFFIQEGRVSEHKGRKVVRLGNGSLVNLPKETNFEVLQINGPTIWLHTRNDELAKAVFLEYEETKLTELKKMVERKTKIIKMLKK